jgi:hypothetical protein
MAQEGLHKHAFWLYGVIVGLSIEEALKAVVPHFTSPPEQPPRAVLLDGARLLVFLVLIIRFYLGSGIFFDVAYASADADRRFPKKNYALDFLTGIIHFLFFFGLAIAIDAHANPLWLFPSLVGVILFYDLLWFIVCREYDTRRLMKMWMAVNLGTLGVAALFYLIAITSYTPPVTAELIAYIPILFVSAIDLGEMVRGRPIFARWLAALIDQESEPEPIAPSPDNAQVEPVTAGQPAEATPAPTPINDPPQDSPTRRKRARK